ncbi:MAG: thioesterase family protein [Myxococcales bacterium]|nr:thioesterase family protein [Myxococcales bacterium]
MSAWEDAARVLSEGEGVEELDLGETWTQGPGIYGGLTAAALARAFQRRAPGLPLRSMALQYCAPLPAGRAVARVRTDRRGTKSAFVSGQLEAGGGVAVSAMATLAADRAGDLDHVDVMAPEPPPPDEAFALPYLAGVVPVFTQHLDARFVTGIPYGSAPQARSSAWVRWREPSPVDRPLLVGLLDAMPPALLAKATPGRAASTVTFQLHLLAPIESLGIPDDAWLFSEVWSDVTRSGWSDEEIRLWWLDAPDPAHRLLAVGRQLFALLR